MDAGSRLVTLVALLIAGFLLAGCEQKKPTPFQTTEKKPRSDRDAPFDPANTYPEAFSDQPAYVKSPDEPVPEPRVRKDDPIHYFTNKRIVMVRRPGGYNPEELPRVSVWWSDDNGFNWTKAGFFGRGQSYFPFEVKADGDYGIRFVGPGQPVAMTTLPLPQRVYHVDTVPPAVEVAVEPTQAQYAPEDVITIRWRAEDFHLVHKPIRVFAVADYDFDGGQPLELQRDLDREGTMSYTIPGSFADAGIRIRVEAMDRAGNLGLAYSHIMQILEKQRGEVEVETALETKKPESTTVEEIKKSTLMTAAEIEARIRSFIFASRENSSAGTDSSAEPADSSTAPEPVAAGSATETPVEGSPSPTEPTLIETASDSGIGEPAGATPDLASIDALPGDAPTTDLPSSDAPTPQDAPTLEPATADAPATPELSEPMEPVPTDSAAAPDESAALTPDAPVASPVVGVDCPPIDAEPLLAEVRLPDGSQTIALAPVAGDAAPDTAAPETPASDETAAPAPGSESDQPDSVMTDLFAPAGNETPVSITPGEIVERPSAPAPAPATNERPVALKSMALDPTRGNGLMVPMPATVYPERTRKDTVATLHPWRELGRHSADLLARVWELPRPQFGVELNRMFKDQAIVEQRPRPEVAPAAKPAADDSLADISLGADVGTQGDQP